MCAVPSYVIKLHPILLIDASKRYIFYTNMTFDYDPNKSASNKIKHGMDFDEAQVLWNDPNRLIIPAKSETELRFALLASHDRKIWAAFYTERGPVIRIISVRRARKAEVVLYEG